MCRKVKNVKVEISFSGFFRLLRPETGIAARTAGNNGAGRTFFRIGAGRAAISCQKQSDIQEKFLPLQS